MSIPWAYGPWADVIPVPRGTWKYAVTDTITTKYSVHCHDITAYITLGKCVFSEYYTI